MTHIFASISIDNQLKTNNSNMISNDIENKDIDMNDHDSSSSIMDDTPTSSSVSSNSYLEQSYTSTNINEDDEELASSAYNQLFKAISNGNLPMVKKMLDYGLNVNYIYDKEQNYSFLHLACLMGHSKVIRYLLDNGANANFVTSDGHQPIDFIESDDLNTISYMLLKMNHSNNV